VGQYLIKHTCNEQPQYKNGAASPTIPVSVGMPENSQKKTNSSHQNFGSYPEHQNQR